MEHNVILNRFPKKSEKLNQKIFKLEKYQYLFTYNIEKKGRELKRD